MFNFEKPEQENEVCPGESKCPFFSIAESETGDGLVACTDCRLLPTKPKISTSGETAEELIFRQVLYARAEAKLNGGYIDKSSVTTSIYAAAIEFESLFESAKTQNACLLRLNLEAFLGSLPR